MLENFKKGSETMENLEKTFPKTSINWLIPIYLTPYANPYK